MEETSVDIERDRESIREDWTCPKPIPWTVKEEKQQDEDEGVEGGGSGGREKE